MATTGLDARRVPRYWRLNVGFSTILYDIDELLVESLIGRQQGPAGKRYSAAVVRSHEAPGLADEDDSE